MLLGLKIARTDAKLAAKILNIKTDTQELLHIKSSTGFSMSFSKSVFLMSIWQNLVCVSMRDRVCSVCKRTLSQDLLFINITLIDWIISVCILIQMMYSYVAQIQSRYREVFIISNNVINQIGIRASLLIVFIHYFYVWRCFIL